MKLDRSRPYGTVYGEGEVRYEQDNKQFDANGEEMAAAAKGVEAAAPPKKTRKRPVQ